jgi:hypothetical protein
MSDDFSDRVKKALADRVGHLCSNPDCRALTSGPQDDPAKAVNVGVAAHITAASTGGPRYDPDLLPEERSASSNGIWLCQNCAKLIDNDPARFTVEALRKWKSGAESEAKDRVGKTARLIIREQSNSIDNIDVSTSRLPELKVHDRVHISPIVPREHEQSDFRVVEDKGGYFIFEKLDSTRQVDIPKSFVEKIHKFSNSKPALVQLSGRVQWVSMKRNFALFPDKPPAGPAGAYGIGKDVDVDYPRRLGIAGSFAREERLPQLLSQGWYVFYDLDGTYLRWPGKDANQILVCNWV